MTAGADGLVVRLRAWIAHGHMHEGIRGTMDEAADTIAAQATKIAALQARLAGQDGEVPCKWPVVYDSGQCCGTTPCSLEWERPCDAEGGCWDRSTCGGCDQPKPPTPTPTAPEQDSGCPQCGGDCASENIPVDHCPMHRTIAATVEREEVLEVTHTDCRSASGSVVGMIDAAITLLRLVAVSEHIDAIDVQAALKDLAADDAVINLIARSIYLRSPPTCQSRELDAADMAELDRVDAACTMPSPAPPESAALSPAASQGAGAGTLGDVWPALRAGVDYACAILKDEGEHHAAGLINMRLSSIRALASRGPETEGA